MFENSLDHSFIRNNSKYELGERYYICEMCDIIVFLHKNKKTLHISIVANQDKTFYTHYKNNEMITCSEVQIKKLLE